MKQYLDLLADIMQNGVQKGDRTGTGTLSVFGRQMRFDLAEGFPLVTTKKVNFKAIVAENLWFLSGHTNVGFVLWENGVHIWDKWATKNGSIGPMYGKQLRDWATYAEIADYESGNIWAECSIDQVSETVDRLKSNPDSRRHVMTTWNPADLPDESLSPQENVKNGKMALAPCHGLVIQFDVSDGRLSCSTYQRSADAFLGLPFNIAGYALLTHLFAEQCGYEVGELIYSIGSGHLYLNHLEQAELQLTRTPYPLPQLRIKRKLDSIFDYKVEDFELEGYQYHPAIKAPVSV
jgi:thymidylate synthase